MDKGYGIAKYRKKPIEIEAVEFNGWNFGIINDWITGKAELYPACYKKKMIIHTLEGNMTANVGDYIIKGVNGEFYPCKRDIFEKTYELVEENFDI